MTVGVEVGTNVAVGAKVAQSFSNQATVLSAVDLRRDRSQRCVMVYEFRAAADADSASTSESPSRSAAWTP